MELLFQFVLVLRERVPSLKQGSFEVWRVSVQYKSPPALVHLELGGILFYRIYILALTGPLFYSNRHIEHNISSSLFFFNH